MAINLKELAVANGFRQVINMQQDRLSNKSIIFEFDLLEFDRLLKAIKYKKHEEDMLLYIKKLYASIEGSSVGKYLGKGLLNWCIDLNKTADAYIKPSFKIFLQELIDTIYTDKTFSVSAYNFLQDSEPYPDHYIEMADYSAEVDIKVPKYSNTGGFVSAYLLKEELRILFQKIGFANTVQVIDILRRMRIIAGVPYRI